MGASASALRSSAVRSAGLRTLVIARRAFLTTPQSAQRGFDIGQKPDVHPGAAWRLLALIALHVPVGAVALSSPLFAGLHALAVFAVGLIVAAAGKLANVAVICAYIATSEVLWRMARAPIPYEYGKYATVAICLMALLRLGKAARIRWQPIIYFVVLLPSSLSILSDESVSATRVIQMLSFNLSGPLSLCMSIWLFSQVPMGEKGLRRTATALVIAAVAVASATLYGTLTATDLTFNTESNFATSGGFGPNQVSTTLGLGALVGFMRTVDDRTSLAQRLTMLASTLFLLVQTAMTFSRGGLYAAAAAALFGGLILVRQRRARRSLAAAVLVVAASGSLILPQLNVFTDGMLRARFAEIGTTNRVQLIREDLELWMANPIFGIGPGASESRRVVNTGGIGHTEPTRLLAEHGSLGLAALFVLFALGVQVLTRRMPTNDRAYRWAFVVWSAASMMHAAMRIQAIGFVLGLACSPIDSKLSSGTRPQQKEHGNGDPPGFQ